MTNPPDNPSAVPPADDPRQDGPTTPSAPAAGTRRAAWYRRLPGRLGIWIAAAALVAACVIGCVGFIAGAVVSHGFGEHGYGERGYGDRGYGEHGVSRDDRWGHDGQRGGDGRNGGRNDGDYGPGGGPAPKHERGRRGPTPTPPRTGTPAPAPPSSPSPGASPTA